MNNPIDITERTATQITEALAAMYTGGRVLDFTDVREVITRAGTQLRGVVVYVSRKGVTPTEASGGFASTTPETVINQLIRGESRDESTRYIYIIDKDLIGKEWPTVVFLYKNLRNVVVPDHICKDIVTLYTPEVTTEIITLESGKELAIPKGYQVYRLVNDLNDLSDYPDDGIIPITAATIALLAPRGNSLKRLRVVNADGEVFQSAPPMVTITVAQNQLKIIYGDDIKACRWHNPKSKKTITPAPCLHEFTPFIPSTTANTHLPQTRSQHQVPSFTARRASRGDTLNMGGRNLLDDGFRGDMYKPSKPRYEFASPIMATLFPQSAQGKITHVVKGGCAEILPHLLEVRDPVSRCPVATILVITPIDAEALRTTLRGLTQHTVLIITAVNYEMLKTVIPFEDIPNLNLIIIGHLSAPITSSLSY